MMEIEGVTLGCRELVELVSDHFEGKLSPEASARFRQHLAICDACGLYVEQMRQTLKLAGRLREEDVSPEAMHALSHAFARWKQKP